MASAIGEFICASKQFGFAQNIVLFIVEVCCIICLIEQNAVQFHSFMLIMQ